MLIFRLRDLPMPAVRLVTEVAGRDTWQAIAYGCTRFELFLGSPSLSLTANGFSRPHTGSRHSSTSASMDTWRTTALE